MKRTLFILCILLAGMAFGGPAWTSPQGPAILKGEPGQAPSLTVSAAGSDRIELELSIPELGAVPAAHRSAGAFTRLALGDYGYTQGLGLPALPVIRELLEIPHGADCFARLVRPEYVEVALSGAGLPGRVMPRQAPVPKSAGARESAPFVMDEAVYGMDAWCLDSEITFEDAGFIRGSRVGLLEIRPVNYNPATGSLRILTRAAVEITFAAADEEATRASLARYGSEAFQPLLSNVLLNHDEFAESWSDAGASASSRSTGYLIICHTTFMASSSLQDFIAQKNRLGFEVTLVSNVDAGSTKENGKG